MAPALARKLEPVHLAEFTWVPEQTPWFKTDVPYDILVYKWAYNRNGNIPCLLPIMIPENHILLYKNAIQSRVYSISSRVDVNYW